MNEVDFLKREICKLELERDLWQIKFSIEIGACSYMNSVAGGTDHIASRCNQCLLHHALLEKQRELEALEE